ncbi:MAG: EF-hand domain-containing protein [Pseudobdellovibrionaceae bacterium]
MVTGISSSSSLMTALMAKLEQSQQASAAASLFSKTDADSSGAVSLTELTAKGLSEEKAAALMSAADTDGDSSLSEDEFLAYVAQMSSGGVSGGNNAQLAQARSGADMLTAGDTDGDGVLSYDEFAAMKPEDAPADSTDKIFAEIDVDADGSLSADELDTFSSQMAQAGGKGPMMGPPPPPPSDAEDEDDTSVSSVLSQLIDSLSETSSTDSTDESDTASATTTDQSDEEKLFNYFDQDDDGVVNDDELNTGLAALQSAMQSYLVSLQESRMAA